MLRAAGCLGGRTGERAPLLIQEGDGAFAPGVVTGRGLANGAILRSQRRSGREEAGGRSYDVGKSEIWCPGFPRPGFPREKVSDTFPTSRPKFRGA
jgi:hypothetical protein